MSARPAPLRQSVAGLGGRGLEHYNPSVSEGALLNLNRLVRQNFEGVIPLAAQKTWKAPQHAERLQGACGNDATTVKRFPAELLDDFRNLGFGCLVVAA